jgi:hypothetical protein
MIFLAHHSRGVFTFWRVHSQGTYFDDLISLLKLVHRKSILMFFFIINMGVRGSLRAL